MLTVRRKSYRRKPYTRKDGTRVKGTIVPATTYKIKDRGVPGRGPKVIPYIRKGLLGKYGYNAKKPAAIRRKALVRSAKVNGYQVPIDQLIAVRTLNKRTNPSISNVFNSDILWMRKNRSAIKAVIPEKIKNKLTRRRSTARRRSKRRSSSRRRTSKRRSSRRRSSKRRR